MIPRAWIAAAALAGIVGAYGAGLWHGGRLADARHQRAVLAAQQATMRAAEAASLREAQRLAVEAERDALARELEDAARADPDTGGGLGIERVRRLNRY